MDQSVLVTPPNEAASRLARGADNWDLNGCGRHVVKTPIKTIAKMHQVLDAPLFEPRYKTTDTAAVASCQARPRSRCSSVLTRTYPSAFRMAKSSFKWSGGYSCTDIAKKRWTQPHPHFPHACAK